MASVSSPTVNILTVDVEDYFHVSAFAGVVSPDRWESFEPRVERNVDRMLGVFADAGVRATFFVLGWVAERHPELLRRIAAAGHELAAHSFSHRLVYEMTADEFRFDLRRVKTAIEAAAGQPVLGYRAPSFSITARSMWALDVLLQEGFQYDASIFPIHHDRYGIPNARRDIHVIRSRASASLAQETDASSRDATLLEIPASTVRFAGMNFPVSGGGYFRILPYAWTAFGIRRLNRREGRPAMVYLHPWELDRDQPRLQAPWLSRFRHYRNLEKTEPRLRRLLSEFRFASVRDVLPTLSLAPSNVPEVVGRGFSPAV